MSNFITNQEPKDLKNRLIQLINASVELKFLVGFFYFSGISELYESLKNNQNVVLKILVGLNVDVINKKIVEFDFENVLKESDKIDKFFYSIKSSINNELFDTQQFYEQITFFLNLIIDNRIVIRKTEKPNHSKLYLFKLNESQVVKKELLITGSSNLTSAGLVNQHEFNVEISDYGFKDAESYFDDLWKMAIKITENDVVKKKLIEVIENETLIKEISPFEAYCYILKCYVDTYQSKKSDNRIKQILKKNGYSEYSYQLDAINQAVSIIEHHNGVLIADVVGLGKSIIASAVAKTIGKRGIILCPPGLVGDENHTMGWKKYREEFGLHEWKVRSSGDLESVYKYIKANNYYEVIIIDEVHKFRNQDTENYELLKNICRDKIVILLTATPFNNSPSDILSLLKLFITPKKSTITLDDNIEVKFSQMQYKFDRLSFIIKYYNSKDAKKKQKAEKNYKDIFGSAIIDLLNVKNEIKFIAIKIRDIIEPIIIRRNRLDLTTHSKYKNEITELSKIRNPEEFFFELSDEQSKFYDLIIGNYFCSPDEGGKFKGSIYRPFEYEEGIVGKSTEEIEKLKEDKNREFLQQRNLFDIMRRMIVKRFESSFGAFEQTILNFLSIYNNVLEFITKRGNGNPENGEYILDRKLLDKIVDIMSGEDYGEKSIDELIQEYIDKIEKGVYPKSHKIYKIEKFKQARLFINDIKNDIVILNEILKELKDFKLIDNDPKSKAMFDKFETILKYTSNSNEPKRKILVFSEFADTIKFVEKKLNVYKSANKYSNRTLVVYGNISKSMRETIDRNFNATAKEQDDDYDIILTTDKLSEGFNLNRAGVVINYDIPWNPVRVIQRVGRINRISKKVFDELMIVNFFPTEKGANFIRSREIASNKMFMIHNTLGEDTKIFDADETPTPSKFYEQINKNPDSDGEINIFTKIFNLFEEIKEKYPDTIDKLKNLPPRIKTSKEFDSDEMLLFIKKNRMYAQSFRKIDNKIVSEQPLLDIVLNKIKCEPETKGLKIDQQFWEIYETAKMYKDVNKMASSEQSIEKKALINLNYLINYKSNIHFNLFQFIKALREDIIDYGTLPDYTLRRIANLNTSDLKSTLDEIKILMDELGEDYLEKIKVSFNSIEKEIIIAVMNKENLQETLL